MSDILIEFDETGASPTIAAVNAVAKSVADLKRNLRQPIGVKFGPATGEQHLSGVMRQISDLRRLAATPIQSSLFKSLAGEGFTQSITPKVMEARKAMALFNQEMKAGVEKAQGFGVQLGFLGRLLVAMGVRKVVHDVIELTDAYTNFQNKLKVVVSGTDALKFATQDLIRIANESRTGLEETGILFSRVTQATSTLGKSQGEVTQFTENMNKAIQVSGATSVEAKNAIIQLSQGMALGTLRGQDLKSVLEFLPYVSQLIANKMGVAASALKTMGAEGKITTDTVFSAIIEAGDEINQKFSLMTPTISQAFEVLKNKYLVALGEASPATKYLALGLKGLADNFDLAIRGATALGVAITLLWTGNAMKSLVLFLGANPWALFIAGALAAVTAVVMFGDKINVAGEGFSSLQDLAGSVLTSITTDLKKMGEEIGYAIDLFKTLFSSGSAEGGTDLGLLLADIVDELRILSDPDLLAGVMLGIDSAMAQATQTHTQVLVDRAKSKATSDMKSAMKDLEAVQKRVVENDRKAAIEPEDKKKKKKGGDAGKTFDQLIREATFDAQNKSEPNEIQRRIENKLHDSLEKLKPSIKAWARSVGDQIADAEKEYTKSTTRKAVGPLTAAEFKKNQPNEEKALDVMNKKIAAAKAHSAEYARQKKLLEEQIRIEETWKDVNLLIKQIQKEANEARDAENKKLVDDFVKYYDKIIDKEKELEEYRSTQRAKKDAFLTGIAEGLDPGLKTNQQIADLERFKKAAAGMKDSATWIRLADAEIAHLQLTLTSGGRAFLLFGDQMSSIFGPGGTLAQGMADALVNARNLTDAFRDLLGTIGKQALSALIQLPINAALGSITQGLAGGVAPSASGAKGLAFRDTPFEYADGGYTGNYGTNTPAGIVHGQEYVMNAESTRKYRPMLEAMNSGGGTMGGGTNVTVHNYAGVQVESSSPSHGEVQIMITRAVKEQTGAVVANQINNPNSSVSRAINRSTTAERRRL